MLFWSCVVLLLVAIPLFAAVWIACTRWADALTRRMYPNLDELDEPRDD